MKKTIFLVSFLIFWGFYPVVSEASLKGPITINQAIEAATGFVQGVPMNAEWQRGYLEISIGSDEVRVEKVYFDPKSGRMAGLNLRDDDDFIGATEESGNVKLEYVNGFYKIRILKADGQVSDVYVNEADGKVFY
ncbi:MAG: hypothetical protein V3V95_07555 [Thermodesulfobacteriota bacterium]